MQVTPLADPMQSASSPRPAFPARGAQNNRYSRRPGPPNRDTAPGCACASRRVAVSTTLTCASKPPSVRKVRNTCARGGPAHRGRLRGEAQIDRDAADHRGVLPFRRGTDRRARAKAFSALRRAGTVGKGEARGRPSAAGAGLRAKLLMHDPAEKARHHGIAPIAAIAGAFLPQNAVMLARRPPGHHHCRISAAAPVERATVPLPAKFAGKASRSCAQVTARS